MRLRAACLVARLSETQAIFPKETIMKRFALTLGIAALAFAVQGASADDEQSAAKARGLTYDQVEVDRALPNPPDREGLDQVAPRTLSPEQTRGIKREEAYDQVPVVAPLAMPWTYDQLPE
jgi:hypothetical protein